MDALFSVVLISSPVFFVWALLTVFHLRQPNRKLSGLFAAIIFVAAAVAIYTTFFHDYYANPNTQVYGWPLPRVVFQRTGPDEPWLDFIGWTIVGAYPANTLLFLYIPSVVFLILARRSKRGASDTLK